MYANRPSLSVYDDQQQVATSGAGTKSVIYNSNQNTLRIYFANSTAMGGFTANEKVRLGGNFAAASELADSQIINGREFTINNVNSGVMPLIIILKLIRLVLIFLMMIFHLQKQIFL